jgi:type III pantothenate kinase
VKNIAVDWGNSRIKVGIFDDTSLIKSYSVLKPDELNQILSTPHDNIIVSSVKEQTTPFLERSVASKKKLELKSNTPLPITIHYTTPNTLGVDRIADACGAIQLFPNQDCLIIDIGTCINYELIDKNNNYKGGIISPGINLRFRSMNTFTAQLPLVEAIEGPEIIGDSTIGCLQSGVMNGILEEMSGFISNLKAKYPELRVILTGGDYPFFENQLYQSIFAAPDLVLVGLNRVLIHQVSK